MTSEMRRVSTLSEEMAKVTPQKSLPIDIVEGIFSNPEVLDKLYTVVTYNGVESIPQDDVVLNSLIALMETPCSVLDIIDRVIIRRYIVTPKRITVVNGNYNLSDRALLDLNTYLSTQGYDSKYFISELTDTMVELLNQSVREQYK